MSANFQIDVKKSNSNPHVIPKGQPDGPSTWNPGRFSDEKHRCQCNGDCANCACAEKKNRSQ